MSKLKFVLASLAVIAFTGLQSVSAQQNTNPERPRATQDSGQAERSQVDQGARRETRKVPTNSPHTGPVSVREALTQKLVKANQAEIELAQMAQQKTDNQDVRQLAEAIIQDHSALNEKLQPLTNHAGAKGAEGRNEASARRTDGNQTDPTRLTEARATGINAGDFSATVPQALCQITEAACDNALKMTKEMLNNYNGQDFNMAFLGQQCVAHTMMLAELQAIESEGPEDLQAIAKQASSTIEMHLKKTKELAKKLENDTKSQG